MADSKSPFFTWENFRWGLLGGALFVFGEIVSNILFSLGLIPEFIFRAVGYLVVPGWVVSTFILRKPLNPLQVDSAEFSLAAAAFLIDIFLYGLMFSGGVWLFSFPGKQQKEYRQSAE